MRPESRIGTIVAMASLLVASSALVLLAQPDAPSAKRRQLGEVQRAVEESRRKLQRLDLASEEAAREIARADRVAARLDSAIGTLERRERHLAAEMIGLRSGRDSLTRELDGLLQDYSRATRALFRHRLLTPRNTVLLLPEEHRMLALKRRLFDRYSHVQRLRAAQIIAARQQIITRDSLLALRREQQMMVIETKRRQIVGLLQKRDKEAEELATAQSERAELAELVRRKNAEARQISAMIERLAAAPKRQSHTRSPLTRTRRAPKAQEEVPTAEVPARAPDADRPAKEPSNRSAGATVEAEPRGGANRSAFRWPVGGRRIVERYGERTNPQTQTVTINPGINIAAATGTVVTAAAEGTVSLVSWLPSYGTVVIVEHPGGYRTVYANLASASVSRGTRVRAGQSLGTVGASHDGEFLHFEVWNGRNRLDPATVLP